MNKEKRKPGRPRSAEADNAIVEATLDLLDQGGVEAVKIEEVARRAGVARTTVYRRFPSRSDLVLGACEDVVSRYLRVHDTGSVRSDVVVLHTTLIHALTRTRARHVIPNLLALRTADPKLEAATRVVWERRRDAMVGGGRRLAPSRGECPGPSGLCPHLASSPRRHSRPHLVRGVGL